VGERFFRRTEANLVGNMLGMQDVKGKGWQANAHVAAFVAVSRNVVSLLRRLLGEFALYRWWSNQICVAVRSNQPVNKSSLGSWLLSVIVVQSLGRKWDQNQTAESRCLLV
jgi:hypothetical protein